MVWRKATPEDQARIVAKQREIVDQKNKRNIKEAETGEAVTDIRDNYSKVDSEDFESPESVSSESEADNKKNNQETLVSFTSSLGTEGMYFEREYNGYSTGDFMIGPKLFTPREKQIYRYCGVSEADNTIVVLEDMQGSKYIRRKKDIIDRFERSPIYSIEFSIANYFGSNDWQNTGMKYKKISLGKFLPGDKIIKATGGDASEYVGIDADDPMKAVLVEKTEDSAYYYSLVDSTDILEKFVREGERPSVDFKLPNNEVRKFNPVPMGKYKPGDPIYFGVQGNTYKYCGYLDGDETMIVVKSPFTKYLILSKDDVLKGIEEIKQRKEKKKGNNELQPVSFTLEDGKWDQYIPQRLDGYDSGSWLKFTGGDVMYQYRGILVSDPSKVVIKSGANDFYIVSKEYALEVLKKFRKKNK